MEVAKRGGLLMNRSKRNWTKEEIDYLLDRWGEVSVKGIAERLGRSTSAVRQKGYRIGLGKPTNHMDGVLVHQFAKETGISYMQIHTEIGFGYCVCGTCYSEELEELMEFGG